VPKHFITFENQQYEIKLVVGIMPQSAYVFKLSMRCKFTPIFYGSEQYDYLCESEVVKENEINTRVRDSRLQPKCK